MPAARSRAQPLELKIDTADAPDLAPWAERAGRLMEKWYPRLCRILQSDGFVPPNRVKLVFRKNPRAPASTAGKLDRTITVSARWVRQHPDDFGMIIHELTHVVQAYPRYDPPWLIEGIADYIRYYHFEPNASRPPIDLRKASYRDGYRTTAGFLAWAVKTYDHDLIRQLNEALRTVSYTDELWRHLTGKPLDRLWREYVAEMRRSSR